MPKKAGGGADADGVAGVAESEAVPAPPRAAGSSIAFPSAGDDVPSAVGSEAMATASSGGSQPGFNAVLSLPQEAPQSKAPAFTPPRPLSEVSFDDAKPSASTPPGRPAPDFPPSAPEQNAPSFAPPKPLSETSFDDAKPETPRPAPPSMPGFQVSAGGQPPVSAPTPGPAPAPMASAAGMGISITGAGMPVAPKQTPAQMSAGNQALRIRLMRPDGKPFDGPEITTGPKKPEAPQGPSRAGFDTPRGPKKQAPKIVVKAGPLERAGHTLAVLLISAVGIVPLAYLLRQSVHDREDKLAATITVPTKMNVLDTTAEAYLGGMVAVLLVVTVLYWMRLKRRRER